MNAYLSRDPKSQKAMAALMSLPIYNPERNNLRERFSRYSALASKTAAWLTLAEEYSKRRQFERDMAKPPYRPHVLSGTVQSKPKPFETGMGVLPGMERWRDQLVRSA